MNRTRLQLLLVAAMSLVAVALVLATLSTRGAAAAAPVSLPGSVSLVSDPSGGLSPRDIQREAEQRSYRRQRRRIRLHGDAASAPANTSSRAGVSLVLVLVLAALLALPMVASRISARGSRG
jgi:hypothetical protein